MFFIFLKNIDQYAQSVFDNMCVGGLMKNRLKSKSCVCMLEKYFVISGQTQNMLVLTQTGKEMWRVTSGKINF